MSNPNELSETGSPKETARFDGEIRVTGTAKPIEEYLAEYEATLPPARLKMEPEFPPQAV